MKKCLIIGGGFAGLSAAAFLASEGYTTEIIEASPRIGGRAYSFTDENTSCIIDNGQHIMMGCYYETLKFLRLTGAADNFLIQPKLKVNFLKENFELHPLETNGLFYPFNLASALLNYKALGVKDRLRLLGLFLKVPLLPEKDLSRLTVYEWLVSENQNERIRAAFWDILAVGALNTNTKKASASVFLKILKEIFFRGNQAAVIILPAKGLSEAYCRNASGFILSRGGTITTGESVVEVKSDKGRISEVITGKRVIKDYDYVISAVPQYAFRKIFPQIGTVEMEYSPIVSVHLWLKNNPPGNEFYGLINSPVHWIFNHGSHLTLVISDASDIAVKSKEEIYEIVICELEKYTAFNRYDITGYKVIKEKRATFIPSNEVMTQRPGTSAVYNNLFLAGDWIDTGLPSTIESAVKSGRMAADAVININV